MTLNLYPTECSICEEEVAVEYDDQDQQVSDLCGACKRTVCLDCWPVHDADDSARCKAVQAADE